MFFHNHLDPKIKNIQNIHNIRGINMFDPIDIYVGKKLRLKRRVNGLTQSDIGDKIGTTFQQIQKYEKGENRISASKLYKIATVLNTSVSYFFDGYKDQEKLNRRDELGESINKDSVELMQSFNQIKDDKLKRKIKNLIDSISVGAEE